MHPSDRAVELAGGVGKLADILGIGLTTISNWRARGTPIPAEHCPVIERELGIACEELRPDVPWSVLRCRCDEA